MFVRRQNPDHGYVKGENPVLDAESRSMEIITVLIAFSVISTLAVSLRTYIRFVVLRTFGWDDGVMIAAQVFAILAGLTIGMQNKFGLGFHTWMQPEENFIPYMKWFYMCVIFYNTGMCLVKISILLQYRRVFAVRMMQRVTLFGICLMTAWMTTVFFLNVFICVPIEALWDSLVSGRCLPRLTLWYMTAGYNLSTDIIIFCLPLPVIRGLQLPKKQKIALFAVFCLGFLTCIISIIRLRTLETAASTTDSNWENVDAAIWSFLEVTIAITSACLPTLRPLLSKFMPRVFGSSLTGSHGPSSYIRASSYGMGTMSKKTGNREIGTLVTITAGNQGERDSEEQLRHSSDRNDKSRSGIQTTTVVQQVVMGKDETTWDETTVSESGRSL